MEKVRGIFNCSKNKKECSILDQTEIKGSFYSVEHLHNRPSLIEKCCSLINSEWKRSMVARMRSIENSSDNFPMSLILLENNKKVVGHCKISRLSVSKTKVFIETVVIESSLRGKGLGKFLMEAVEVVCRRKNIQWAYLSTLGQEGFYKKLGYSECPPVSVYGIQYDEENENNNDVQKKSNTNLGGKILTGSGICVPPPPPLPRLNYNLPTNKTFMRKEITF